MTYFVTGAAGFIGSNLVDRLLAMGQPVVGYDNFSTGKREFLAPAMTNANFRLVEGDLLDAAKLTAEMRGADTVFHLAANADVGSASITPRRDLEQNTVATFNVLEAVRLNGVKTMAFSSTGSVYGEPTVFPTPEDAPFPLQTSLYGASKLACEGLISAYAEGFKIRGFIFRFVSILGERYTHGHVLRLRRPARAGPLDPAYSGQRPAAEILPYVQDCIDAVLKAIDHADGGLNVFNLGTSEYCKVNDSAQWISERLQLHPRFTYSGGERGWVGDSPFIFLKTDRIQSLGWQPRLGIRAAVECTVDWLRENDWVFGHRDASAKSTR